MELGFGGEVPDFYHQYRHGYPDGVIDILADTFQLSADDLVVDLGCGTGQLTFPVAARVRAVVGVDPELDMLRRASQAARELNVPNVSWMLGSDTDLPRLGGLFGGPVGAVTVGQALHWMADHDELFRSAAKLVRPGGGIAVVTNGTPLWLQDTDWSRALHGFLAEGPGQKSTAACGTDEASQQRYRDALAAAGLDVQGASVDYEADLSLDQIVGGICSALPEHRLPAPAERPAFAERIRVALGSDGPFSEHVHVAVLTGRVR
jgi:SAM-dependent methyltransferase